MQKFDVVIVGGGHAGCEAAAVAARAGAKVALVTLDAADFGTMSCNPAIGGLGKGHLVREIDALDGLMGRIADTAGIQFRLLNRRKGAAVQGPRVQCDRGRYRAAMSEALSTETGITRIIAETTGLLRSDTRITGIATSCGDISAAAVVLTTGTFLGGIIHIGDQSLAGGRIDARRATRLGEAVRALGLQMARLKTGTPPRLDGRTIDWAGLDSQPGDAAPVFMSALTCAPALPQLACAVTRTTGATHAIVRDNIALAPMYAGRIAGVGPRYCPSLEDKVMRFADRDSHQIFLEPEGLDNAHVYPNGISTSLPLPVQQALLATIPGLSRARIVKPGYAIEYDHVDPRVLTPGLRVTALEGLWLAGQINGTTGYEEAAAQGLVAGLNATLAAGGRKEVRFDRTSSYIGVMIDDLVTQGVSEPYRMFTSRAEYRLRLRIDNAALRLGGFGKTHGIIGRVRADAARFHAKALADGRATLDAVRATPSHMNALGVAVRQDGIERTAFDWLRFDKVNWEDAVRVWPILATIDPAVAASLATDAHYASYLARQDVDVARFARDESLELVRSDFSAIPGVSTEMATRLSAARPATIGAASRVPGITPAALTALLPFAKRAA